MVKKRSRFMPGFQSRFMPARPLPSTRSSVRASTVGPYFPRRTLDDDALYVPYRPSVLPHYAYDSSRNEYATTSDINRELIMSSAAMEDNYDITARSRQRDKDVLAAANRAISTPVDTPSLIEPLQSSAGATGYTRRRSTTRRSKAPRSHSVPPKRPTYTTTTTILPLDLKASEPPKPSAYLNYSKTLDSIKQLRCGTYDPMYSDTVRTSYSPARDFSPYRSDSPFRLDSPYRSVSPYRDTSPYRDMSPSPLETRSRLVKKRHKPPRVLASKRRVGNYYDRLLARKSKDSKVGKYWPYIDVEDIDKDSLGDVLSDTEIDTGVNTNAGYRYDYVITGGDDGESYAPVNYSYNYEPEDDIPNEYVPFRPRTRIVVSPERDYSQMSILPYLPARDPTKNSVQDDISFNAVVAASAARARRALENVNLNEYDSAGLVFSVEGEYTPPEEESSLAFRYVSRPLMLKIPASQRVRASDSDNAFTKYMTDLQKFREGIRARLEDGYKAISRETVSCIAPTLPAITSSSYTSMYNRPIRKPYRSRLTEDAGYKYGHSLELYPLSSGSSSRSLMPSDDITSGALKLYDSKNDKYSRLGTLARVEIKVDTEVHSTARGAVAALRARGHSTPPAPAKYARTEAALLANKVEVNLPTRKRQPRSSYAQARLRQMRKEKQRDDGDVEPIAVAEVTSGLKAHPPVYDPSIGKPYWGVEGVRKPNVMSWQYRLDTYVSPEDMIIVPRSLNSVRSQLRQAHDKLDHHKQLVDRYLVADKGFSVEDSIVLMNIKSQASNSAPASSSGTPVDMYNVPPTRVESYNVPTPMDSYKGPMSSARRRARRVLAMTKNDPHYYKPEEM